MLSLCCCCLWFKCSFGSFTDHNVPVRVTLKIYMNISTKLYAEALTEIVGDAVGGVGEWERGRTSTGQELHRGVSQRWREAIQDREVAQAVIFGLLLNEDDQFLPKEISFLKEEAGAGAKELALQWQAETRGLHSARKIALVELALPTLRGLSPSEYERFRDITRWLIASDEKVELFEFDMLFCSFKLRIKYAQSEKIQIISNINLV